MRLTDAPPVRVPPRLKHPPPAGRGGCWRVLIIHEALQKEVEEVEEVAEEEEGGSGRLVV